MSRGVNKVILVGNCCADPEVRYTQSGAAVTNISIATNESWTDKQSGQKQERAEFHRIVFFNKVAEIAAEYLRKGSLVYIEGALRTRKWQDQQGQDKYTTEIVASEMQMLGGGQGGTQGQGNAQGQPQQGYGAQAPQQAPQQNQQAAQNNQGGYAPQGQNGYSQATGGQAQNRQPPRQPAQQQQQARQAPQSGGQNNGSYDNQGNFIAGGDAFDDDIPF